MKFCKSCNSILRDDDVICPQCGAFVMGETSSVVLKTDQPIEMPLQKESAAVKKSALPEPELPKADAEPVYPVADADTENSASEAPSEDSFKGVLELQAEELSDAERRLLEQQDEIRPSLGKLGAAAIVLMSVAAVVLAFVFIVKPLLTPAGGVVDDGALFKLVCGSWLSGKYVYVADAPAADAPADASLAPSPAESYVELLTINADYSFKLDSLIPNAESSTGYSDGTWAVKETLEGTVKVRADDQCIVLCYKKNNSTYYFERYVTFIDEKALTLREYYTADKKDSFDIKFSRIS
ncbi:MAG: hypothetical protein RSE36_00710 [Oscillospiraceae bacterium]